VNEAPHRRRRRRRRMLLSRRITNLVKSHSEKIQEAFPISSSWNPSN